ncbi:MAG: hypothetical protein ABJB66_13605 [Gemmatimonadaceae bacterium]
MYLSWLPSRMVGYGVRVYVVRGVLIDCGFRGAADDVKSAIAEFRPRDASLTYHHEDHAGNVNMHARTGVPIGAVVAQNGGTESGAHFLCAPQFQRFVFCRRLLGRQFDLRNTTQCKAL